MHTLLPLLRDGLRLALLRKPRSTPLDAGFAHWLVMFALVTLLDAGWHWPMVESPREFSSFGLQTAMTGGLLRLAASALLCALLQRRALFWNVAAWTEAASIPLTLVCGGMYVAAMSEGYVWAMAAWWLALAWTLAVLLRLGLWLATGRIVAGLGTALLATAILFAPWIVLDAQMLWDTDWEARYAQQNEDYDPDALEPGELAEPEATMYAQTDRLAAALAIVAPQRPDRIDMFVLAFGGDASENVFRNEVDYIAPLFEQRFDARGHTLSLLNHPDSADTRPLATATNLERALLGLGQHMDRTQDILFLYLTSHGSEDHRLYVNQPPLALDQLTPERLRAALDASGIRWRVVVVSACYSGGFVEALDDPGTLILTAAREDRTSFGCGADSDITWFGRAFLAEALNHDADFVAAFEQARQSIAQWEKDGEHAPSEPQIRVGGSIPSQLSAWRDDFDEGAPLPFVAPESGAEVQALAR